MGETTDDELFIELVTSIVEDVLSQLGEDSELRFQFFKKFVALATLVTSQSPPTGSRQRH